MLTSGEFRQNRQKITRELPIAFRCAKEKESFRAGEIGRTWPILRLFLAASPILLPPIIR